MGRKRENARQADTRMPTGEAKTPQARWLTQAKSFRSLSSVLAGIAFCSGLMGVGYGVYLCFSQAGLFVGIPFIYFSMLQIVLGAFVKSGGEVLANIVEIQLGTWDDLTAMRRQDT